MPQVPNILTIAGSDSGGGAGIQADLKTINNLRGFGMSAISALTAQNGLGVSGVHAPPAEFLRLQLETLGQGFPIHAAKSGMLFSAANMEVLAKWLEGQAFPLVLDPVCVSQSGQPLIQDEAIEAMIALLLPKASLLTPNRPEAERLTGMSINNSEDVAEAGQKLLAMGAKAVLIKGGHFEQNPIVVTDWLISPDNPLDSLVQPHIDTPHNHGTGCTLSAAIATYLGFGLPLRVAVTKAQEYLNTGLRQAFAPGKGVGCPNHLPR